MAQDWARYMYENKDVYDMYGDGGKYSWDVARPAGIQRNDGQYEPGGTAALYAQQHYSNFGQREGRQVHEAGGTNYGSMLMGGGGGGGGGASSPQPQQNESVTALQKQISELTQSLQASPASTEASRADASQSMASTILTGQQGEDKKKKKSFLTPFGA